MKPIQFPEQNAVYAESQTEYNNLPAFKDPNDPHGEVITCWELTLWERIKVLFTGVIWHRCWTFHDNLQPQLIEADRPFLKPVEVTDPADDFDTGQNKNWINQS